MKSAEKLLQQYWGYTSFRPLQKEIIQTVNQQNDVVAILPTGSGKSVIYQIAGLLSGKITLVISPLIALIEDQVNNLKEKNIKAVALTGNLNFYEQERLLDNVQFGEARFLFLSPERLQNNYLLKRLSLMPIGLISIDEAHCISEWGHDFRPAYLKLKMLRELLPHTPILALTATAKNKVVEDIKNYLNLNNPTIFRQSVVRKNIAYKVFYENEKLNFIVQYASPDETAIVYVNTRKQTYKYAAFFNQNGLSAGYFHGGMTYEEKQKTLNDWLINKTRIIVATTAFGMGIDKSDVRKIYHFNLPYSIENYTQESGRAGRDGKMSQAILLVSKDEIQFFIKNFEQHIPNIKEVYKVYKSLFNYYYIGENDGRDALFDFNFADFCKHYQLNCQKTFQILQILENEELIKKIQQTNYHHTAKILITPTQIRTYITNREKGYQILNFFVRTHNEILHLKTKISPEKIAHELNISVEQVIHLLKELHQKEIIEYQASGDSFQILFLKERNKKIFKFHQKRIEKRLQFKKEQLKKVWQYAKNKDQCRSRFLAEYFEEENISDCGVCDVCQNKQNNKKTENTTEQIIELLKKNCLSKQQLLNHFTTNIDAVLDRLIEQKIIYLNEKIKYCLKVKT